jgi:hypothetical protein
LAILAITEPVREAVRHLRRPVLKQLVIEVRFRPSP